MQTVMFSRYVRNVGAAVRLKKKQGPCKQMTDTTNAFVLPRRPMSHRDTNNQKGKNWKEKGFLHGLEQSAHTHTQRSTCRASWRHTSYPFPNACFPSNQPQSWKDLYCWIAQMMCCGSSFEEFLANFSSHLISFARNSITCSPRLHYQQKSLHWELFAWMDTRSFLFGWWKNYVRQGCSSLSLPPPKVQLHHVNHPPFSTVSSYNGFPFHRIINVAIFFFWDFFRSWKIDQTKSIQGVNSNWSNGWQAMVGQ